MARGAGTGGKAPEQEFQLEAKHLTVLVFLVVALCVASFMLGRWVERQSLGATIPAVASGRTEGDAKVEEMGDVAKELTFFDTLKTEEPVGLETAPGEAAPRPAPVPAKKTPVATRSPQRSVGEGVMIQVFASKDRAPADAVRKKLRAKGYTALLVPEGGAWKVRVGPYADREEAERSAAVLREQEKLSTWIP